jgi:hypothetical protein
MNCISREGCADPEICDRSMRCMRHRFDAEAQHPKLTSKEQGIERWDLTEGSELRTSPSIRNSGAWVRYDDIKHLLHPETPADPFAAPPCIHCVEAHALIDGEGLGIGSGNIADRVGDLIEALRPAEKAEAQPETLVANGVWIAVAEKMPPPHAHVWCLNRDGRHFEGAPCYGMHVPFFTIPHGDGSPSNTAPAWIDVTHWRPLPASPETAWCPECAEKQPIDAAGFPVKTGGDAS